MTIGGPGEGTSGGDDGVTMRDEINAANGDNDARGVEDRIEGREPGEGREPPARDDGADKKDDGVLKRGSKFDDKRARLAETARQKRAEREGDNEFAIVPPEREKAFFGEGVKTRTDRIVEARVARGEDPEGDKGGDKPATRTLKVNGRDVVLSEEDIIKHASRALAGDDHLQTAKAERDETRKLLDEVRTLRAAIPEKANDESATKEAAPAAIPEDAELDQIVDRLQVGEVAEAREALAKYGGRIEERVLQRLGNLDEVVDRRVNEITENRRRAQDINETWTSFKKDRSEYDKPAFQAALAAESASIMRERMKAAGLDEGFIEHVKTENRLDEPRAVRLVYDEMKKLGHQLPSTAEILVEADKALFPNRAVRRDPPPTDLSDRSTRKDMIRSQPRRAAIPSALENREKSREDRQRDALVQMRKARGRRR